MYRPGFNYLKAGVMLVELQPQDQQQGELDFFSTEDPSQPAATGRDPTQLMGTVDALNRRFGRGAVGVASAMPSAGGKAYAGQQERRSPRCVTRLDEIPFVVAA